MDGKLERSLKHPNGEWEEPSAFVVLENTGDVLVKDRNSIIKFDKTLNDAFAFDTAWRYSPFGLWAYNDGESKFKNMGSRTVSQL